MLSSAYQEVVDKAQTLSLDEQYKLLHHLMILLVQAPDAGQRSILELQGLGKKIWAGIDAQKYVDKERESWNG